MVPSVAIQTSTFDVGVGLVTGMLLCPGCIGIGAVSAAVSSSWAGVAVGDRVDPHHGAGAVEVDGDRAGRDRLHQLQQQSRAVFETGKRDGIK